MPAQTLALMAKVSNSVKPFCAATVPKAIPKAMTPGVSGSTDQAPSRKPASVQRGAWLL